MTNVYEGVQNVLARISFSKKSLKNETVLVNCHFDSVPHSPGATDDAVSCGIMLETLSVLSQSNESLNHDIIFLFNGAEETILPVSYLMTHSLIDH